MSPVALAVLPNDVETDLLKQIEPATVLLFAGKSARDKPDDATLKALANTTVLRTDERGTIQYILDGDTVVMQSDK